MESFEEAKEKFSRFLAKLSRPEKIAWLFREDVSQVGAITFYRLRNLAEDENRVRAIYLQGVKNGLGVTLFGKIFSKDCTAAYIWVPKDEDEAGRHLQCRGLKLSASDIPPEISHRKEVEIKNDLIWRVVEVANQKKNHRHWLFEDIPFRKI